ncbi:MAG: CRTAC1 family protein [Verrucomicrobiae bacterium]|nr:CRTAC1 family protein [Verrucomicrobiae bacterium]
MIPAQTKHRIRCGAIKLALGALAFSLSACFERGEGNNDDNGRAPELSPETLASQVAASLAEEESLTLADELRVRPGELALFDFWDDLRQTDQPMEKLAQLPVKNISLPGHADCVIAESLSSGSDWASAIREIQSAHGYTLTWSHWEHLTFDPKSNPPSSVVDAELHFASGSRRARTILKAQLTATWSVSGPTASGEPPFTEVVMSVMEIAEEQQSAFHRLQAITVPDTASSPALAAPLLVRDLNRDHYQEVILLGSNTLLWNQANCSFVSQPLTASEGGQDKSFRAGVFGEFTGDQYIDLALIDSQGNLSILPGASAGAFVQDAVAVASAPIAPNASSLSAADIDGDGDSDLFIAQDKPLFVGGQMPAPVIDAAGGNPSYLLRNNGSLQFADITEEAGLGEKRNRRVKDSAFNDFDGDGDPDLFLANAFAPIDVFENREGRFVDVSGSSVAGAATPLIANKLVFADKDGDHLGELAVAAVQSSAAARIEAFRAASNSNPQASSEGARPAQIADSSSRMFSNTAREIAVAQAITAERTPRQFLQASTFSDAGWANDIVLFDYENDGDLDCYIANGHISGKSTTDFDLYFWQRELRAASSIEDPVIALLFTDRYRPKPFQGLNEGRISWQGHQANRFYRNDAPENGSNFHEIGFLAGAALTEDSLATRALDLDLDGRIDLLVVTQDWDSQGGKLTPRQSLTVLRNENADAQNWIGFLFDNVPNNISFKGISVDLEFGKEESQTLRLDDGASTIHLGLGSRKAPTRATIHWMDGTRQYIDGPSTGRYLRVQFALD